VLADKLKVLVSENVSINNGKSVYEGTREALSAAALMMRILGCKYAKIRMSLEGLIEFRNVNFPTVIKAGVQPL
jgi:hypothetical protein